MSNHEKEFARLGALIGKYAHRWSETPSARLQGWVDAYNDLRDEQPEAFARYCASRNFCPTHTAFDVLA